MTLLVALSLDDQGYALHLSTVERITRMVQVTPLPAAPDIVAGVINVQGEVIPVVDIRKRFLLPERAILVTDQLIVAQTSRRRVALIADAVTGVVECGDHEIIAAETIVPGIEYVEGVAKLEDGTILIHDLDRLLSLDEEQHLDQALMAA